MKAFINGLLTGLLLQLAIGPVFFFIINLALQRTIADGFMGVLAVTTVDYLYIALAIFGIGRLLENKNIKKVFGIISSALLAVFGLLIIKSVLNGSGTTEINSASTNLLSSYTSVFLLTISSPMTIVFFTSLFTAKAVEYNYTKNELYIFGIGTGLATLLFMGNSVFIFSLFKSTIPALVIQALNFTVGSLLIGYGAIRLLKILRGK